MNYNYKHSTTRQPRLEYGGIYCLSSGAIGESPLKIGMALSFKKRFENYLTAFYDGFRVMAYLSIVNMSKVLSIFSSTTSDPKTRAFDPHTF